ncbi:hypothetical protein LJC15_03195, partial [Desulfovibrio sp. OttesenSCG-928-G11]|nr:hypothetical protein [Desulfovibrio sp. OttesenSCG-928-G11]
REVVMSNIAKSLKDTGLFICFEPTHNNFLTASIRSIVYYLNSFFDHKTERGFSSKELDGIAKKQGLTPVAQLYPGLLAYILWYNPDAFPLLNRGSEPLAKKYIRWERTVWASRFAYYLSFATLTCYKKDSSADSGQREFHEKHN